MNESEGGQGQEIEVEMQMLLGDESLCVFEKRTRVSLTLMLIVMQCNAPALATVPGDLTEESGG